MIRFLVPLPPSSNALWRMRTTGKPLLAVPHLRNRPKRTGVTLSETYKVYRDHVVAMANEQINDAVLPMRGDLELCALVFWPDDRTRDGTNLLKALYDALQAARVFANDNQVKRTIQDEAPGIHPGHGCVWVCIRPLAVRSPEYPFAPPLNAPVDTDRNSLLDRFSGFRPTPL